MFSVPGAVARSEPTTNAGHEYTNASRDRGPVLPAARPIHRATAPPSGQAFVYSWSAFVVGSLLATAPMLR